MRIWRNLTRSPAIRRRILFTLLILAIYRLLAHVPIPGIDRATWQGLFPSAADSPVLFNLVNLLSGGAAAQFSILGLGVIPYITAWDFLILLTPLVPALSRLDEEGATQARRVRTRLALLLTVPFSLLYVYGLVHFFSTCCGTDQQILPQFGFLRGDPLVTLAILVILTAGTFLAVWLGWLIDSDGIGTQGINLIVFSGVPTILLGDLFQIFQKPQPWAPLVAYLLLFAVVIFALVLAGQASRDIPVQYGRRPRSNVYSSKTVIPLRMPADFEPAEYAQTFLLIPGFIAGLLAGSSIAWLSGAGQEMLRFFSEDSFYFWPVLFVLTVLFSLFTIEVNFTQEDIAEILHRQGGFIPGIRPGEATRRYLAHVIRRLAIFPGILLGFLVILPWLIRLILGIEVNLITGAALLFLVVVIKNIYYHFEAEALMLDFEYKRLIVG